MYEVTDKTFSYPQKKNGFYVTDHLSKIHHLRKQTLPVDESIIYGKKIKWKQQTELSKRPMALNHLTLTSAPSSKEPEEKVRSMRSSPNEAVMSVDRDANEYNMQHQNRGHAVIFNHDQFDKRCKPRVGSKHDVERLQSTFSSLGFIVTVHNNRTLSQIQRITSKLAQEDHSDNDCLAVIVMTCGNASGELVSREGNISYSMDMIWEPFTSDKCPTLAGKPKLFFIQACRGRKVHTGMRDEIDLAPPSCSIPRYPDFLTVYSSTEGFLSYRDMNYGSWFIQSLCKELNMTDSLMQILIKTTRRITLLAPSNPGNLIQVPSSISTLRKNVYFHPKDSNNMQCC